MPTPPRPRFARALESMRGDDPAQREAGFDFLREHADAYVDDLIAEFEAERLRRGPGEAGGEFLELLLELICEARSPAAFAVLAAQLESEDEGLRFWAVRGLEMLDTHAAREALERAYADGMIV